LNLLQTVFVYIAPFVLVITVIVVAHEMGHFLTARAFGVAVDRFSIGFGRPILSWRDRGGVEWRIGWLPLGGYVRFSGDENAASIPVTGDLAALRQGIVEREGAGAERRYILFKPLWQRTLVVLAGPAANFLLAVVLFAVFFGVFGEPQSSTRVDQVIPGSAADAAGLRAGDTLVSLDGRGLRDFQDLQSYVQYRAGVPIRLAFRRGDDLLAATVTPQAISEPSPFGGAQTIGRLGLAASAANTHLRRFGPLEAVVEGVRKTAQVTGTTIFYLGRIVTGQVSAAQLHSAVGIAKLSGAMTSQAVAGAAQTRTSPVFAVASILLQLTALMSVSVGLLNLAPVPTLDGGHLLFYAYEWVARAPPRPSVMAAGYRLGLALLVGLMLFATWNDLQRLRVIHLFGSLFS